MNPITCPYCNAILDESAEEAGDRRVCSTCGESFQLAPSEAIREGKSQAVQTAAAVAPQVERALQPEKTPKRMSNARMAGLVLLLMFTMAGAGLALALWTVDSRRANDKGIIPDSKGRNFPTFSGVPVSGSPSSVKVRPKAPSRLEALRYLPRKTNVLLGMHLAELRADPVARKLLARKVKIGPVRFDLASVAGWTGLPLDELDHCVFGVTTSDQVPRINLIVRTRRAFDPKAVRERLSAEAVFDSPDVSKELYRIALKSTGVKVVLWIPNDRTLAYGFLAPDLKDVPSSPHPDLDHLPVHVRELLVERSTTGSPLWAAAQVDDWEQLEKRVWFPAVRSKWSVEERERIHNIRACLAWVQFADPLSAWTVFQCGDGAGARSLAEYVGGPDWKKERPELRLDLSDAYLTLRYRTTLERLGNVFGR